MLFGVVLIEIKAGHPTHRKEEFESWRLDAVFFVR
jgi:hypothetical protein